MTESLELALLGLFALGILVLDWKLGTFGIASERDKHPINFWISFGLTLLIALTAFAVAIAKAL